MHGSLGVDSTLVSMKGKISEACLKNMDYKPVCKQITFEIMSNLVVKV